MGLPKDANGNTVEPFTYNGTTYLPVRAIGNALGKNVSWDGKTNTVYVGEAPENTLYAMDVIDAYQTNQFDKYYTNDGKKFSMMGVDFTNGLKSSGYNADALFNLNHEYSAVTFTIGHIDNEGTYSKPLNVYMDNKLVNTYELTGDMVNKTITLNTNGVLQLKFEIGASGWSSEYGIGNIILTK